MERATSPLGGDASQYRQQAASARKMAIAAERDSREEGDWLAIAES
jgi:hypothetical protein